MKYIIILIFGLNSLLCFAQTQTEMNGDAYNSFEKADSLLNKVYSQILEEYKSDTLFIQNLKNSQRIWIKFRDAELKMKYPDYGDSYYGSMQPLCAASYLEKLTKERIETLNKWLNKVDEGEGCGGSIKFK